MLNIHTKTEHSYMSVRKNAFFLDWQTQPKNTKTYPHFYKRFKISDYEELKDLNLIGAVTFTKSYPQGEYSLRTVPSAGGLYPCEIYIQIRGIKGLISGIYHFEPFSETICLLQECENDGVEYYFDSKVEQKGIIFLISSVYFRSSWKYRDRSIRYILLDAGHQLGAIYASSYVMDKKLDIDFNFDKLNLNKMFGFREDEIFITSASCSNRTRKEIKSLKQPLPYVCGSDYLENNDFIYQSYKNSLDLDSKKFSNMNFFSEISNDLLKDAILKRRSIRAFRMIDIFDSEFEFIVKDIFDFAKNYNIEMFYTLHRVKNKQQGLYKEDTLIKSGDFSAKSKYLSLEQNLGGQSAVTFYFTSNEEKNYQVVNVLSGFLAHIIYLKSEIKNIGCSGIGAYYDKEVKEFLETNNNILYMLAIGR